MPARVFGLRGGLPRQRNPVALPPPLDVFFSSEAAQLQASGPQPIRGDLYRGPGFETTSDIVETKTTSAIPHSADGVVIGFYSYNEPVAPMPVGSEGTTAGNSWPS